MLTAGHCLCQTLKRDPKSHKDALCKSSHDNQIVPETMQTSVKDEFNHTVTSNYATAAAAADYSLQNLDNYYTKTSEEVPKSNSATEEQQQNNSNNTGYLSTDCTFLYAVVMSHEDIS